MKTYNIIISIVLFLLIILIFYLKPDYESIEVDPMGDGQSGIGKAMVGLLLLGCGLLPLLFAIISGFLVLVKPAARTRFSYINLFASLLITMFTVVYFFGWLLT